MRLVVEYDPAAAGAFVAAAGHPNEDAVARLRAGDAAVLRVAGRGGTCGYFWYCWISAYEMALYASLPVGPGGRRGLWTRQVVGDLHKFPALLGARRLVAAPPTADVARLLRRMGWVADGDGRCLTVSLLDHWSARYGRDFPVHLQRAATAGATGADGDRGAEGD